MINGLINSGFNFSISAANLICGKMKDRYLTQNNDENPYLKTITYPVYDSNNPDHFLIQSNDDWDNINGTAHYYYVMPGDYRTKGIVNLTASGTVDEKRYIILGTEAYSDVATHPGILNNTDKANVQLWLNGGNYWVIDRMSTFNVIDNSYENRVLSIRNSSSNNIINRCYFDNYYEGIQIVDGCHSNTIQKCRISNMCYEARYNDKAGIIFAPVVFGDPYEIKDTIITECEILNANDQIQTNRADDSSSIVNLEGLVIHKNKLYITNDIYYDSVGGNLDPNGMYAMAEDGLDLKAGSTNFNNPIVITNNYMWGFRRNARDGGMSGCGGMHKGVGYIKMEDNYLFDAPRAWNFNVADGGRQYCVNGGTFKRNVMIDINKSDENPSYCFYEYSMENLEIEDNIINSTDALSSVFNDQHGSGNTYKRNVCINTSGNEGSSYISDIDGSDNYYYNAINNYNFDNDKSYPNASDANMESITFSYDIYTDNPKSITLNNAKTTPLSPHYNINNDENPYLETITYPAYDSNNPDHFLIQSTTDFDNINGTAHYYYIMPGDYTSLGRVNITASGTVDEKRYIILGTEAYSDVTTHPGKLLESEQAFIQLEFDGASYWVVDRISMRGARDAYIGSLEMKNGSQHNILNRMNVYDFDLGLYIWHNSYYTTIQKCWIHDQTLYGRKSDRPAIYFTTNNQGEGTKTFNCKIIENDIRNTNDGVMLVRSTGAGGWPDLLNDVRYDGTIIDNNNIWITPDIYTDCSGNLTTDGPCSYSENAIDLKAGSEDANNPIIVTNNRMWGYRKSDTTDSGLGGSGKAITIHYHVPNTIIENNFIADGHYGIGIADNKEFDYVLGPGCKLNYNVFYNLGAPESIPPDGDSYSLYCYLSDSVELSGNIMVDSPNSFHFAFSDTTNTTFSKNILINMGNAASSAGTNTVDNNYYYNTNPMDSATNSHIYANGSDANMNDYTFEYERYTNNPKTKTLIGVVTTENSPHYNI